MNLSMLASSLMAVAAAPTSPPGQAVFALWQAFSHGPGAGADEAAMRRLFHPEARIIGSRYGADGQSVLGFRGVDAFLAAIVPADPDGFHECEIEREVRQFDRFAVVYSVVESRRDALAAAPDVVGVNSVQLHRGAAGWQIVSLHYQLPPAGVTVSHHGRSGHCLDAEGQPRPIPPVP